MVFRLGELANSSLKMDTMSLQCYGKQQQRLLMIKFELSRENRNFGKLVSHHGLENLSTKTFLMT